MNENYRDRHSYAKKMGDQTRYFAVYGKDTVEIEKEVYDFLQQSYAREWQLEKTERKHRAFSLDQLEEDIERFDHHGSVPTELLTPSAEAFMMNKFHDDEHQQLIKSFTEEVEALSETERQIVMTFVGNTEDIHKAASTVGVSDRQIYNRRKKIADRILAKLKQEEARK